MDLREIPSHAFARHPWETARARFFSSVLRDHVKGEDLAVVDFGAGDGFFARTLVAAWPAVARVVCFDPGYAPGDAGAGDDARICFTPQKPTEPCDVLLLLDVLEHDANDQATLHAALANLRPGGWLLVSVPAHQILFSRHDELLGHKRRYSQAALRRLVQSEGITTVEEGQLFASLVVPRALAKLAEALGRRQRDPDAQRVSEKRFEADGKASFPSPQRGRGEGVRVCLLPSPCLTPNHRAFQTPSQAAHVDTSLGSWKHGAMLTRAVEATLNVDAAVARRLASTGFYLPGLSIWLLARKP